MNLNPDFETEFANFGTCCIKRGPSLHLLKNKIGLRQMARFSLGEVSESIRATVSVRRANS
jgi:hypothetical protein